MKRKKRVLVWLAPAMWGATAVVFAYYSVAEHGAARWVLGCFAVAAAVFTSLLTPGKGGRHRA